MTEPTATTTAADAWGAAIRQAREDAGLSQARLATELGVDRSAVTLWEAGRTAPRADMQPRVVRVLSLDVASIYAAMATGEVPA